MSSSCSADQARHGEAVRSLATSCSSVATLATADVLGVFHCAQLLSAAECQALLEACGKAAESLGGWPLIGDYEGATSRHLQLEDCAQLHAWRETVLERAVPLLAELFCLPPHACTLAHCRVVKYLTGRADRANTIAVHSDGTPLSFILALDESFEGGVRAAQTRASARRAHLGCLSVLRTGG